MSLDVDGRQAEKGKTEHSTAKNFIGWMLRPEINDSRQSTDGMVDRWMEWWNVQSVDVLHR